MKYIPDPFESEIVKEIFTKYASGYTVKAIADNLKERGIRDKNGNYILTSKIYRMLQNKKYNGFVTHGDKVYDNIFPKLVDDITFQIVQSIANENKHAPGRKKDIYDFILSGKLVCGECGKLMVGESGTSMTGDVHYYYSCLTKRKKRGNCSNTHSVRKEYLEDTVIKAVWEIITKEETVKSITKIIVDFHQRHNETQTVLKSLEAKKASALKATNNIISAIEQGIITEQTKDRLKELEAQISQLEFDIGQAKQRSFADLTVEQVEKFFHSITCGDFNDVNVRKIIVKTFVREVIYYKDHLEIIFNFIDQPEKHLILNIRSFNYIIPPFFCKWRAIFFIYFSKTISCTTESSR